MMFGPPSPKEPDEPSRAPRPTVEPQPYSAGEDWDPAGDFVADDFPVHSDPEAAARDAQIIEAILAERALDKLKFDTPWHVNEETVLRTALARFERLDRPLADVREANRRVQDLAIRFRRVTTGETDGPAATVAVCPTYDPVEPDSRNGPKKIERRLAETSAVLSVLHGNQDAAVGQAVRAIVIGKPDWRSGLVRAVADTFVVYVMPTKLFSSVASMLGEAVRNINHEREDPEKKLLNDFEAGQGFGGLARESELDPESEPDL